ncbi:uncharacterized protein LOC141851277 isoform X2 [Brevipalpus obovatus]|uniref:uncharacterized protein LOC141851277 isoform X2 n=1 Tax=Brevipalpus obovatus TaxID=246614 RepID=UPI003D9DE725
MIKMFSSSLIILICLVFLRPCHTEIVEEHEDQCIEAKLPLRSWEIKPYPFVVHVWNTRFLHPERSCTGIVAEKDTILIPKWCIRSDDGSKRGQIAIYAPKPNKFMTTFSRSNQGSRYDEQFDLIFIADDVKDILYPNETFPSNIPNAEVLKLPIDVPSHLKPICFWREGNIYDRNNIRMLTPYFQHS